MSTQSYHDMLFLRSYPALLLLMKRFKEQRYCQDHTRYNDRHP